MKIALIGYGKMGQRIHALAKERGHQVDAVVIGKINAGGMAITASRFAPIEVSIEFTAPVSAEVNLRKLIDLGQSVVCGTTGWITDDLRAELHTLCLEKGARVLYGSNLSLGVQLFLKLVCRAGELLGDSSVFSASLNEVHHLQKVDAPSGTAVTAATMWLQARNAPAEAVDHFSVTSQRVAGVFGEHELRIRSPYDDIRIRHEALSRDGFASGALKSAGWLVAQEPGFYLIEDVVEQVLS